MQSQQEANDVALTIPFLAYYYTTKNESKSEKINPITTGTTSFFRTTFNCLNPLSGVGILSIPFALSSGGWLSLILLLIIATATFYTGVLIKRWMDVITTSEAILTLERWLLELKEEPLSPFS